MSRFTVIAGGPGSGNTNDQERFDAAKLKAKSRQLGVIRQALTNWQQGAFSPHGGNVFGLSSLAVFSVVGLAMAGDAFAGIPINFPVMSALALASGIAAAIYIHKRDRSPRSHVDHLDRLLAAYDPVERDAYVALQQAVSEIGALDRHVVERWLQFEESAIQKAAGWQMPSEGRFLKKRV